PISPGQGPPVPAGNRDAQPERGPGAGDHARNRRALMRTGGNNQGQGRRTSVRGHGPGLAPLAWALALAAAGVPSMVVAQAPPPAGQEQPTQAQQPGMELSDGERTEVARMMQELAALKAAYSQEVRRLRELDMQMQALQARISGRAPATAVAPPPPQAAPATPAPPPATAQAQTPPPPPEAGYASTAEDAERVREEEARSVSDVRQQQQALFNQRLVIDNGVSYNRYDRKQLTLNGFLALDAIFL